MFEIYKNKESQHFHYRLKAANGQVILQGKSYDTKKESARAIESVLLNGNNESRYEVQESKGQKFFVLTSSTGEVIGRSQFYKSESGLKNGIMSVGNNIANCRLKVLC